MDHYAKKVLGLSWWNVHTRNHICRPCTHRAKHIPLRRGIWVAGELESLKQQDSFLGSVSSQNDCASRTQSKPCTRAHFWGFCSSPRLTQSQSTIDVSHDRDVPQQLGDHSQLAAVPGWIIFRWPRGGRAIFEKWIHVSFLALYQTKPKKGFPYLCGAQSSTCC